MQKKQWSKPVLIVLGRETPEEHVLLKCSAIIGCQDAANLMICRTTS